MTFWIIAAGAALILAFFLFRTLISPVPTDESETQLAIYKDQLSEIERDEARGTLTADEAKRLRTEVSRRILAADDAQKIAPKSMSATEVAVVVAIVVLLSRQNHHHHPLQSFPRLPRHQNHPETTLQVHPRDVPRSTMQPVDTSYHSKANPQFRRNRKLESPDFLDRT